MTTSRPITADTARFLFYDVESLSNIFTVCTYQPATHHVGVYYLLDAGHTDTDTGAELVMPELGEIFHAVREANPARAALAEQDPSGQASPTISFYDLRDYTAVRHLAQELGGVTDAPNPNPDSASYETTLPVDLVPVCDTHPGFDPFGSHPFITGYNSFQYDTTIMALFFALVWEQSTRGNPEKAAPVTAATMRHHNDQLFRSEFRQQMTGYLYRGKEVPTKAGAIRQAMIRSGRHLDIARLNEVQRRVGLKRLLGQMGHQILESDRLSGPNARVATQQDIVDLLAYNVSDVIGTHLLMRHPVYTGAFDLRAGLLSSYPEAIYESEGPDNYASPRVNHNHVRRDRLTYDTFSAQFAARILAPYRALREIPGHLGDLPAVSFLYPHPSVTNTTGRPRVNVLDETRKFFYANVTDPAARADFDKVFNYYRSIEGRNFNEDMDGIRGSMARLHRALSHEVVPNEWSIQNHIDLVHRMEELFPARYATSTQTLIHRTREELQEVLTAYRGLLRSGGHVSDRDGLLRHIALLEAYYDTWAPVQREINLAEGRDPELTVVYPMPVGYAACHNLSEITKAPNNLPYVRRDGTPTSCFATFSTGGIHGAEANVELFEQQQEAYRAASVAFFNALDAALWCVDHPDQVTHDPAVHKRTPEPAELSAQALEWGQQVLADPALKTKAPELIHPDHGTVYPADRVAAAAWWIRNRAVTVTGHTGEQVEVTHADVIAAGSRKNSPLWRTAPKNARQPVLFTPRTAGDTKLSPGYVYTSVSDAIHEDFTSYYPLLLTNMGAFINPDLAGQTDERGNPLPADRYSVIFQQKEDYGRLRKDPSLTDEQREHYSILREGTKLILNAASGAADAGHNTPIKMNNLVISMRIIGQLFSWRIGQAQTFAGAQIISTNTDGLYSVLDMETNQRVLDEHADDIGVEIEPEELTLVSKDSNNRVEFFTAAASAAILSKQGEVTTEEVPPWKRIVASAGGGTLACWDGPNPRKALNHPAITDRILVEYFKLIVGGFVPEIPATPELAGQPLSMSQPFNLDVAAGILTDLHAEIDTVQLLAYYQNIIASSPGTGTHLFSVPYDTVTVATPAADCACGTDAVATPAESTCACPPATAVIPASDTNWLITPDGLRGTVTLDGEQVTDQQRRVPTLLQHYNRVFQVCPDTEITTSRGTVRPVSVAAAKTRQITGAMRTSRAKAGDQSVQRDPVARHLLSQAGTDLQAVSDTHDLMIGRHTGLDPAAPLLVFNDTLHHTPDPGLLEQMLDSLDREAYIDMAADTYEKSWRNIVPEGC